MRQSAGRCDIPAASEYNLATFPCHPTQFVDSVTSNRALNIPLQMLQRTHYLDNIQISRHHLNFNRPT
jgi:hypothetical protein